MGELKLPQTEKNAVLTLHTDKDVKTLALQLKLESFKIKVNEEYNELLEKL